MKRNSRVPQRSDPRSQRSCRILKIHLCWVVVTKNILVELPREDRLIVIRHSPQCPDDTAEPAEPHRRCKVQNLVGGMNIIATPAALW